jgi:hypothetical protein
MYRVYSAPAGADDISPLERDRLLHKDVADMDEAIGWAAHMSRTGHAVLLIEGDDGTTLGAGEIASALRQRAS